MDRALAELAESLLGSSMGIEEDAYNKLMRIAVDNDFIELQRVLIVADATDGVFYL